MGLALLSNLAAYDFGFISAGQLEERTAKTLTTMERLERFRGHFFNWYDTHTLEPLQPRYVSTVDSGNLVGHLFTLREGLLQLADQKIVPPAALHGLSVTLRVLLTAVRTAGAAERRPDGHGSSDEGPQLHRLEQLRQELLHTSPTIDAGSRFLARLVSSEYSVITELTAHPDEQVRWWANALTRQAQAWLDEVNLLVPLAALPPPPSNLWQNIAPHLADPVTQLRTSLERLDDKGTLRDIAQLSLATVRCPRCSSGNGRRTSRLARATETAHQRRQRSCRCANGIPRTAGPDVPRTLAMLSLTSCSTSLDNC